MPLSDKTGAEVHLKLESEQHTNSFKARGAMNKVLSLTGEELSRGVVTSSTGNHAQGVARACMITGCPGTIFLPNGVDPSKIEAIKRYPVDLVFHEGDALETELHAKQQAAALGRIWISPYNDPQIIGGQGTIGIELSHQMPSIDDVFVTVGGGGLIGGITIYLKAHRPGTRIIGCQPERSAAMYHCVRAGRIVSTEHGET
ncbi:MAG: pyridoxal-phosphate dependent enzyme, partial [Gemmatimonadetes bacterium]|nr:pyridoxal-phosphate dependent enzyme [Gemmatimonadota bacterium]